MKLLAFLGLSLLLSTSSQAGWYAAGKYTGVVVFDRWGGCHLITGGHVLEISERAKEPLRQFNAKTIQIEARKLEQVMNPGNAMITDLDVIGLVDVARPTGPRQPPTGSVAIRIIPRFAEGVQEFDVEVRNIGKSSIELDNNRLTTPVFAKKTEHGCLDPADGPSTTLLESMPIAFLNRAPVRQSCMVGDKGVSAEIGLANGFAVAETVTLAPGQIFEVPLRVSFSVGEYQLTAGFGGQSDGPSVASAPVGFDVDAGGKVHLTAESMSLNQPRAAPRVGSVCGTVVNERGNLSPGSGVYLLTLPPTSKTPHVAFMTTAGADGAFRIDAVTERAYYFTASNKDSQGLYVAGSPAPISLPSPAGDCNWTIRLHPYPTYNLSGHTEPGPGRTVRVALSSGEAFPFEATTEVLADGRYEFSHLPPGAYQLSAGANGYGFDLQSDMTRDFHIQWPGARTSLGPDFNHGMAFSALQSFYEAEQSYARTYGKGFSLTVDALGPPPEWYHATAEHAALLFAFPARPPSSLTANGYSEFEYQFTYMPAKPDSSGTVKHYSLIARPVQYGVTGKRNFFIDESGVIHATERDAPATVSDPVLESPF